MAPCSLLSPSPADYSYGANRVGQKEPGSIHLQQMSKWHFQLFRLNNGLGCCCCTPFQSLLQVAIGRWLRGPGRALDSNMVRNPSRFSLLPPPPPQRWPEVAPAHPSPALPSSMHIQDALHQSGCAICDVLRSNHVGAVPRSVRASTCLLPLNCFPPPTCVCVYTLHVDIITDISWTLVWCGHIPDTAHTHHTI